MRAEYDRRRRLIVDGLNAIGLETFEPRGAFYAFPRIGSTGLTDDEFTERLLARSSVAVVPGSAFGPSGAGHVRMCYATSYERLEEALGRIGRFVERVRARSARCSFVSGLTVRWILAACGAAMPWPAPPSGRSIHEVRPARRRLVEADAVPRPARAFGFSPGRRSWRWASWPWRCIGLLLLSVADQ